LTLTSAGVVVQTRGRREHVRLLWPEVLQKEQLVILRVIRGFEAFDRIVLIEDLSTENQI